MEEEDSDGMERGDGGGMINERRGRIAWNNNINDRNKTLGGHSSAVGTRNYPNTHNTHTHTCSHIPVHPYSTRQHNYLTLNQPFFSPKATPQTYRYTHIHTHLEKKNRWKLMVRGMGEKEAADEEIMGGKDIGGEKERERGREENRAAII